MNSVWKKNPSPGGLITATLTHPSLKYFEWRASSLRPWPKTIQSQFAYSTKTVDIYRRHSFFLFATHFPTLEPSILLVDSLLLLGTALTTLNSSTRNTKQQISKSPFDTSFTLFASWIMRLNVKPQIRFCERREETCNVFDTFHGICINIWQDMSCHVAVGHPLNRCTFNFISCFATATEKYRQGTWNNRGIKQTFRGQKLIWKLLSSIEALNKSRNVSWQSKVWYQLILRTYVCTMTQSLSIFPLVLFWANTILTIRVIQGKLRSRINYEELGMSGGKERTETGNRTMIIMLGTIVLWWLRQEGKKWNRNKINRNVALTQHLQWTWRGVFKW